MIFALLIVGGYLLGSLPFGAWVARLKGVDITQVGSGNIGATNVVRTLGWGPGLVVFALDVAKGWGPSFAAFLLAPIAGMEPMDQAICAGIAAVMGHTFSPFLKFKGGKGVATALGAVLGASPLIAGVGFGTFLLVLGVSRYVSLSSVVAVSVVIVFAFAFRYPPVFTGVVTAICLYVIVKHRANMARLRTGTEPKLGQKKKEEVEQT